MAKSRRGEVRSVESDLYAPEKVLLEGAVLTAVQHALPAPRTREHFH
jgi:hypothetical protein